VLPTTVHVAVSSNPVLARDWTLMSGDPADWLKYIGREPDTPQHCNDFETRSERTILNI
jgi:hypothetical protein